MSSRFDHYPSEPDCQQCCWNAYILLRNAHDTSSSFLEIFNTTRTTRNARGASTDKEQDLLRAMLTFACAGLDALVKQLIKDALPDVINCNEAAERTFRADIERRIRRGEEIDHRFLADILTQKRPRDRLIDILISDLTSQSLQSKDQLLRVGSFFDIQSNSITNDPNDLARIFTARNQIVHEMDIDFSPTNRNRRSRTKGKMFDDTNKIFKVSKIFLEEVDHKLK